MKIWILHDTKFGNGKNLAETLGNECPPEWEVKIGDLKQVSPQIVAEDAPQVLILGGALRAFQGAPASKKVALSRNSVQKTRFNFRAPPRPILKAKRVKALLWASGLG